MKRIAVFASGTRDGGGSGFKNLVLASRNGLLEAKIAAVISNHANGGVRHIAAGLDIPFIHFKAGWNANDYRGIVQESGADLVALSGWLLYVTGLDYGKTINIHPGPLPRFGGKGMFGINVHRAVIEAFRRGDIKTTAVTMHFVNSQDAYDSGRIFFQKEIEILENDTPESLQTKVNAAEHYWQPRITNLVVNGKIRFENNILHVPEGYPYLPAARM